MTVEHDQPAGVEPCYTCDHVHEGECGQYDPRYSQACLCPSYEPDPWAGILSAGDAT